MKIDEFQSFTKENGYGDFSISASAEYMMDSGFDSLLQKKDFLPIISNKVLVELSYLQPSLKASVHIFELQQKDFETILAHPERYSYLNYASLRELKKKGCSLQLNLLSLVAIMENGPNNKPFPYLKVANTNLSVQMLTIHDISLS